MWIYKAFNSVSCLCRFSLKVDLFQWQTERTDIKFISLLNILELFFLFVFFCLTGDFITLAITITADLLDSQSRPFLLRSWPTLRIPIRCLNNPSINPRFPPHSRIQSALTAVYCTQFFAYLYTGLVILQYIQLFANLYIDLAKHIRLSQQP